MFTSPTRMRRARGRNCLVLTRRIAHLDALVSLMAEREHTAPMLAAPISYPGILVQCAGRVVRAAPGKDTAEVHDYHDIAVPVLAASLPRRMPGYKTLGFAKS